MSSKGLNGKINGKWYCQSFVSTVVQPLNIPITSHHRHHTTTTVSTQLPLHQYFLDTQKRTRHVSSSSHSTSVCDIFACFLQHRTVRQTSLDIMRCKQGINIVNSTRGVSRYVGGRGWHKIYVSSFNVFKTFKWVCTIALHIYCKLLKTCLQISSMYRHRSAI